MRNRLFVIASFLLLTCSLGCKKWLSVQPKTNISEKLLFEDEQGFKDALVGIYVQLANPSLYAKEFTMAFMDVLAQQYDVSSINNGYYQAGKYNYADAGVEARINQIWINGYKAIANINNLLRAIENKKDVFLSGDYEAIKGEALGLRSFIHFDLFRVFGPMPESLEGQSIPYLTKFDMKVSPRINGTAFLDSCIKDLDASIELLSGRKEVNYGTEDQFFSHTRNHFNFWAANGLKARILLYKGDKEGAYKSAKVVIDNSKLFPFVGRDQLAGSAPNRTFLSEQLFGIYVSNLRDINEGLFKAAASPGSLTNTEAFIQELFEGSSTDYRSVFLWKTDGSLNQKYPVKYWIDDIQTNTLNTKRVPLIRLSEMYFIAAEASEDNIEKTNLLNTIRQNRGVGLLSTDLNSIQLSEEITKSYRKEFYQEGQLFFFYKRKNFLRIKGYGSDMTDKEYVLPLPNVEIEFNNF